MVLSSAYLKLKAFCPPIVISPFHPSVAFRIIHSPYLLNRIELSMKLPALLPE